MYMAFRKNSKKSVSIKVARTITGHRFFNVPVVRKTYVKMAKNGQLSFAYNFIVKGYFAPNNIFLRKIT